MLHEKAPLDQDQLKQIGITARQTNIANTPWNEADQRALAANKAVILYNSNSNAQMYLPIDEYTLLEIDLPIATHQQENFYGYSASFFVLLALGIALWVWPLWRDLQSLKRAAKQTNLAQAFEPAALGSRSLVYPVGQALDELNAKVRMLLKTQIELTGSVAHEFRTPLSRLKFALEAACINDEAALVAINQDILELETLMHEMLSYTSLENQQPELNIAHIPLLSLCLQRIDAYKDQHTLDITLSGDDAFILGDEHFIARAFDNLFQNALRHAASKVSVNIDITKSHIILNIEDDGSGIAPANMEKVFEPFFRPDHARTRNRGGAGLGLAIVKRIALWHNAKCWAQTSTLGGARFCIAFGVTSVQ